MEAASIAAQSGSRVLLRDHGGGFSIATVELHRVSAENYAGDPSAAVAAALRIVPASLPTTERRAPGAFLNVRVVLVDRRLIELRVLRVPGEPLPG
jgi:hypothetical protein